jgi:hypothetical protein
MLCSTQRPGLLLRLALLLLLLLLLLILHQSPLLTFSATGGGAVGPHADSNSQWCVATRADPAAGGGAAAVGGISSSLGAPECQA